MGNEINLKELAQAASNNVLNGSLDSDTTEIVSFGDHSKTETIVEAEPDIELEEDDTVIIGDHVPLEKPEPVNIPDTPVKLDPSVFEDSAAPADMENPLDSLPPEERVKYTEYKKSLLIEGLSPKEASIAVANKIKKDYAIDNPTTGGNVSLNELKEELLEDETPDTTVGMIYLDKTKQPVENLGLTEEEHAKLRTTKAINLVLVEDEALKNIKVERVDSDHKADYVKSIEGALSRYSVPLPYYGDFVTFKGSQLIQLYSSISYPDDAIEEAIDKKASLVYDKILSGGILKKFDEKGRIVLEYDEFANKFPLHDLDLALYGILVASSMEETETEITCDECKSNYPFKYKIRSILDTSDMPDRYKERIDKIIGNKSKPAELRAMHDDWAKGTMYQSPFTNNIYVVSYPSVARAATIYRLIDQKDIVISSAAAIACFLQEVYIYNEKTGSYIQVTEDEPEIMLDTLVSITEEDHRMLQNRINAEYDFKIKFTLHSKCPHCGKEMTHDLNIESLVFWRVLGSITEIR